MGNDHARGLSPDVSIASADYDKLVIAGKDMIERTIRRRPIFDESALISQIVFYSDELSKVLTLDQLKDTAVKIGLVANDPTVLDFQQVPELKKQLAKKIVSFTMGKAWEISRVLSKASLCEETLKTLGKEESLVAAFLIKNPELTTRIRNRQHELARQVDLQFHEAFQVIQEFYNADSVRAFNAAVRHRKAWDTVHTTTCYNYIHEMDLDIPNFPYELLPTSGPRYTVTKKIFTPTPGTVDYLPSLPAGTFVTYVLDPAQPTLANATVTLDGIPHSGWIPKDVLLS